MSDKFYVLINGTTVINRVVVGDTIPNFGSNVVAVANNEAQIGWTWDGSNLHAPVFTPIAVPASVPAEISRRQLLIGLVHMGLITAEEALVSNTTVPAQVAALFDQMVDPAKTSAYLTWLNMTVVYRTNNLVLALAGANDMTSNEVDEFFRICATI